MLRLPAVLISIQPSPTRELLNLIGTGISWNPWLAFGVKLTPDADIGELDTMEVCVDEPIVIVNAVNLRVTVPIPNGDPIFV